MSKKRVFVFTNFFLKSFLDIYWCPISKIKKEFQKSESFYILFTIKNCNLSPKNQYLIFFTWFSHFLGNLLYKNICLTYIVLSYSIFYLFYHIYESNILFEVFFHCYNPINYPSLSKKDIKISKNYPIGPKKIWICWKKSEKIGFFHFFSYGLGAVFIKYCIII